MSGFGDYSDEMSPDQPFNDEAFTALLADPTSDRVVGAFVEDVRLAAQGPRPVPSAALAAMLAGGFSAENGNLPVTAASNAHGPALQVSELPKRRKRMPIPQFIAGMSLVGKLALGASLAAAATGAGAAGALPGPIQDVVAQVVDTTTPFTFPSDANAHDDTPGVDGQQISTDAKAGAGAGADHKPTTPEGQGTTPDTTGAEIGATISITARNGEIDGATVAETARSTHGADTTPPVNVAPVSTPPVNVAPVSTPPVSTPPVSTPPVSVPPVNAHAGR